MCSKLSNYKRKIQYCRNQIQYLCANTCDHGLRREKVVTCLLSILRHPTPESHVKSCPTDTNANPSLNTSRPSFYVEGVLRYPRFVRRLVLHTIPAATHTRQKKSCDVNAAIDPREGQLSSTESDRRLHA